MPNELAIPYSIDDVWNMATKVAESRLFAGVATPPQAFTLMMLCQADGLHPIHALRRYHIIEGRPTMRSDATQAEFQAHGGRIKILKSDATEARAIFSHDPLHPEPFEMGVTFSEFERSGLTKGKEGTKKNWAQSPADMLSARLITKAVRRIAPGIVVGIYSPEEIEDSRASVSLLDPSALPVPATLAVEQARDETLGPDVPGQPSGFDDRPWNQIVTDAVMAANNLLNDAVQNKLGKVDFKEIVKPVAAAEIHAYLMDRATQMGKDLGDPPKKTTERVSRLAKLYKSDRGWLRAELNEYLRIVEIEAVEVIEKALSARQTLKQDDLFPGVDEEREGAYGREPGEDG